VAPGERSFTRPRIAASLFPSPASKSIHAGNARLRKPTGGVPLVRLRRTHQCSDAYASKGNQGRAARP
jgi:hypothetical protein